MKVGVLTVPLSGMPLGEALTYLKGLGVETVEIGCGGNPGKAHCDPDVLLHDTAEMKKFKDTVRTSGLEISAFSTHNNPVHPDREIAAEADRDLKNAILMASETGVGLVNTFSGCPGDCPDSRYPNWVTCAWPDEYPKILDYQWNEVLIPFWTKQLEACRSHGVTKVALEMHPGFCVYNTETMLKLRAAVGDTIGANFDPSHLIWQGIEPVAAIRALGSAIFHVHAKDTKVDKYNTAVNGVLDTKHYSDEIHRSWVFRTVGYGNDAQYWRDMISNLRLVGYDDVLSIEHEDSFMTNEEGLEKAVRFLKDSVISEPKPGGMFWA